MLELSKLLDGDHAPDWVESESSRLAQQVQTGQIVLHNLLDHMAPVMTNKTHSVRAAGMQMLVSILEKIPTDYLDREAVELFSQFLINRLKDHHSVVPPTLRGISWLSKNTKLDAKQLENLLESLFREVMVQQQVVRDRAVVFNMLAYLLYNRFEDIKAMENQFLFGFLQVGEGEKDPRNLVLMFECSEYILNSLSVAHFAENIFESLAVYFPIDFTPPRGVNASIQKEDLVLALRKCLSHPLLAEHTVPLCLEKLESDLEFAKIDSLETIQMLVTRCGSAGEESQQGKEAWVKDNGKLLESVWLGLRSELLGVRLQSSEDVLSRARTLLTVISRFLCESSTGLSSPEWNSGWSVWWSGLWRDCAPHLQSPGTRPMSSVGSVLASVAGSGKFHAETVLASAMPPLVVAWNKTELKDARAQIVSIIGDIFLQASLTGYVISESDSKSEDWLEKIMAMHLETSNTDGLAKGAGVLPKPQREALCDHLIANIKAGNLDPGSHLAKMARWDPDLIKTRAFPELLSLGDPGLKPLSAFKETNLFPEVFCLVSQNIAGGQLSDIAIKDFLFKVSDYDFLCDKKSWESSISQILLNIAPWLGKQIQKDGEMTSEYSRVIPQLAGLLPSHQKETVEKLADDPALESVLGIIVSSLSSEILSTIQELTMKVFFRSVSRHSGDEVAILANKITFYQFDQLLEPVKFTELTPQAVARIAHGLVVKSQGDAWVERLVNMLNSQEDVSASDCFSQLLSAPHWTHPITRVLYKQRAWSKLVGPLLERAPEMSRHLEALILLLPEVPHQLLSPVLPTLLPLLAKSLSMDATREPALGCLMQIMTTKPDILNSYITDIVPRCLELTKPSYPISARKRSLKFLEYVGNTNPVRPELIALAPTVIKSLKNPLQDHKRLVRQNAVIARNKWILLAQNR